MLTIDAHGTPSADARRLHDAACDKARAVRLPDCRQERRGRRGLDKPRAGAISIGSRRRVIALLISAVLATAAFHGSARTPNFSEITKGRAAYRRSTSRRRRGSRDHSVTKEKAGAFEGSRLEFHRPFNFVDGGGELRFAGSAEQLGLEQHRGTGASRLLRRPRLFDTRDVADLLSEKFDQQPDPSNARAVGDNQHAQRDGWQRVVRQDHLKASDGDQIVDKPSMGGRDAASSDEGLARGKAMIDPKTPGEGHCIGFAAWPLQDQRVATRHVRHSDALMAGQILRDGRSSSRRQIIRRCDKQTQGLAESPQLHGAVGERTQAKRDIDSLPDKVDALVGEAQVDPNVGVAVLKGEDQPARVQDPESRGAGYADRSGRATARSPHLVTGLFHKAQDLHADGVVATAFIGHCDTPGGPAQQRGPNCLLKLAQMSGDRRLTDAELPCDRGQAAAFGHADEGAHPLQCHVRFIHFLAEPYPLSLHSGSIECLLPKGVFVSHRSANLMNVLLVFAHPEPRSFNGALRDVAVQELEAEGHAVRVSDLYASGWRSEVARGDFPSLAPDERLKVAAASGQAFTAGSLTADVKAEQERLLWADALILQFPLWWFSMPAILKGWVDRVYSFGFAYGVGEQSDRRWGDRYGEGTLAGKRAMLLVTTGGWEEHYSARGINGPIDDLLFPINHGILYYPGYNVLPPFVAYRVDRLNEAGFQTIAERLRERMRTLATTAPIPYRRQNGGDYLIPRMHLRPGLESFGSTSFALHEYPVGKAEN